MSTSINAEYTIKVKVYDLGLTENENRITLENRIKEIGRERLRAFLYGRLIDPHGKVFEELIQIIPNQ